MKNEHIGLSLHMAMEQIREQLNIAHEQGFDIGGFFMLGFPSETSSEMEHIVRFARSLPLDRVGASYFQPFPGTSLFHELVKDGEIPEDWTSLHHSTLHNLTYISPSITARELRRKRRKLLTSFYLRPETLKNLVRQINSPAHFFTWEREEFGDSRHNLRWRLAPPYSLKWKRLIKNS